MPNKTDDERLSRLMSLAQQGDELAYEALLKELSSVIGVRLRRQFGAFPFIDDCVQETLIAVHAAKHTYQPGKPFKPWLNALIKHKAIDLLRKDTKHKCVVSLDADSQALDDSLRKSQFDLSDYLSGAQLISALDKANRDALIYTKLLGLSVDEAADKLDTTPAAIKQRVKRAIAKAGKLFSVSLEKVDYE